MNDHSVDPQSACSDSAHSDVRSNNAATDAGLCLTKLANLPYDTLVDCEALGGCLAVSTRTLRRMVGRGQIPKGLLLGGRRMWMAGKVVDYLREMSERQEAVAKTQAARLAVV